MDIRPHICEKFICGKETRTPWFAFGALVSPDYYNMRFAACQEFFCFWGVFVVFFSIISVIGPDFWAFCGKKMNFFEKIKKVLDKEIGL